MESDGFYIRAGTVPLSYSVYMLGMSVLEEHLKTFADFVLNGSAKTFRKINHSSHVKQGKDDLKQSIVFVQGTGISVIIQNYIQSYEPSVDADTFKEMFYGFLDRCKRNSIHL